MKCILCGNASYKDLYTVNGFTIQECVNCSLVRTTGKQSTDYSHYHRDSVYDEFENYFKNIFQKRFNVISKYKSKPGKILDIGAATGTLLKIFQDNGWETWGVEPSKSAEVAKGKGIKILKSSFEKANLPKDYFDVVVMNHTLEHVEDPLVIISKIKSLLKKGGIVYLDVPNFDSLSRKLAGDKWKYLLPNEHVHHFTPVTLQKCLQKKDFRIIWSKTWSGIFDVGNPLLKFWQTLSGGKKQFFTDMAELPGNVAATVLNRGTSLAVIGKK